jgi:hypothetical protein
MKYNRVTPVQQLALINSKGVPFPFRKKKGKNTKAFDTFLKAALKEYNSEA